MIIVLILFFLLILEEILHRLNRNSSPTDIDITDNFVKQKSTGGITILLVWLRIVQLLVFGLLFAVIAALSGIRVICTSSGQLAGLVLLIQIVRILNRKVINQWAVLGVTVILQFLLLTLLLISGITPEDSLQVVVHDANWIVSVLSFIVLFLLSITVPFIGTFFLRLISREGSSFYYFLPPLAYSEYWIKRLTRISACSVLITLLMLVFLVINYGYPAGTSTLQILLALLLLTGLSLFRNRLNLYHPTAVFLVSAAWAANIGWLLANLSSLSSGWIA